MSWQTRSNAVSFPCVSVHFTDTDRISVFTADAQGSGINTDIPEVELSSTDAKKIGRVIACYFGFVPNGILATVVGLHDDPAAITRAGKTFCTMASDI